MFARERRLNKTEEKLDVFRLKHSEAPRQKSLNESSQNHSRSRGNATYSISLSVGIYWKKKETENWQTKSIIQGTLAGLIIQWTLIWQPSCPCDGLFSAAAAESRPFLKFPPQHTHTHTHTHEYYSSRFLSLSFGVSLPLSSLSLSLSRAL